MNEGEKGNIVSNFKYLLDKVEIINNNALSINEKRIFYPVNINYHLYF